MWERIKYYVVLRNLLLLKLIIWPVFRILIALFSSFYLLDYIPLWFPEKAEAVILWMSVIVSAFLALEIHVCNLKRTFFINRQKATRKLAVYFDGITRAIMLFPKTIDIPKEGSVNKLDLILRSLPTFIIEDMLRDNPFSLDTCEKLQRLSFWLYEHNGIVEDINCLIRSGNANIINLVDSLKRIQSIIKEEIDKLGKELMDNMYSLKY